MTRATLKHYTILLFLIPVCIQCRTTRTRRTGKEAYKSRYIDQFKLTYFRKVLLAGFNQSEAIKSILKFDRSGFTEIILTLDDYKLIDSLAASDNRKMRADSTNSIGRVAEGAEGKHVFDLILSRFESKWIDSIAKRRYKSSGLQIMYDE